MASWLLAYPLLVLILLAVAIYEHVNTTSLSLPVSPALTILTILLPIFAIANAFYYPQLTRPTNNNSNTWRALLPTGLQTLQLAVTTILGTLLFSNLLPTDARACLLSTKWQRMWSGHDADAIRRIQDTFNCCGFNSVKDRSWPFPRKDSHVNCAAQWGRTVPCVGPWTAALQRSSGGNFGVIVVTGLLQLASILVARWLRSRQATPWSAAFKNPADPADRERARPLLEGREAHGRDCEENSSDDEEREGPELDRRLGGGNGYGSTGPRVEPIHHDPWANDREAV